MLAIQKAVLSHIGPAPASTSGGVLQEAVAEGKLKYTAGSRPHSGRIEIGAYAKEKRRLLAVAPAL